MQIRHRSTGFTLIELLVVISIVSVLFSLLLPQLAKARDQAKLVQCQINLRQAYQGWLGYTIDNKDAPPTIFNTQNSFPERRLWHDSILRYITNGDGNILYGSLTENVSVTDTNKGRYPVMQKVFRCPSTGGLRKGLPWDANFGNYYWNSYFANNFWGTDKYGNSSSAGAWHYYHPSTKYSRPVRDWNSYAQNRNGGRTIIIGEAPSSWISSHTGSSYYYNRSPYMTREGLNIHGGANNGLLGDGSITSRVQTLASVYPWHTSIH